MSDNELRILQRDIDGILESNRLDWYDLATKRLSRDERIGIRKGIESRNVDLSELLHRKWELEVKAKK